MNIKKTIGKFLVCAAMTIHFSAAGQIIIEPLFEYPTAPEEITELQERSNWQMANFWTPMDFKSKNTVDQNALNDAFSVYAVPMQFADAKAVDASVEKLIKSISKNPVLSLQFAKAAEESLYGPRAYVWSDEILLKFIYNVLACKGISKDRKLRFTRLGQQLRNTLKGQQPPKFNYITRDGKRAHYIPNGVITVIEFGDPDCDDCIMAKIKMSTNVKFNSMVEKGKVNVLFIAVDPEEGWEEKVKDYPDNWHVGASEEVADLYDLRTNPSLYIIDREGNIAAKHVSVDAAMQIAVSSIEN